MASLSQLRRFNWDRKEIKLKKVIQTKTVSKYAKGLTRVRKDCVICITGFTGEGKSVLAVDIARQYDKRFTFERNCIYSRKELKEKIETYPPSAFIIDEAINVLYKRDWNTSAQKDLVRLLNICRSKGHFLIFVQPVISDMDKDIRNERIRLWIYVVKRGVGVVFRPIRSLGGGKDPWNLEENDKSIKKFVRSSGEFIGTLEGSFRTVNFLNFIRWEDIGKEDYEAYESIKDDKKYAEEEITLLTKDVAEKMARDKIFEVLSILKQKKYLKMGFMRYVAAYMNLSNSSVSAYLKKSAIKQELIKDKEENSDMPMLS